MSNARNLANLLGTATTIQTAKIADDAITNAKIVNSAITSAKITDGTIATDDIADSAVTTVKTSGLSNAADDITAGDAAVSITTTSGNITIDAAANDSDIIIKGTDDSSDTTFWTFDGSDQGNLVPGQTSTGIYLGVNSVTASNLLNDFETGTFTPLLKFGGTDNTDSSTGKYTKIGNACYVSIQINIQNSISGSGGGTVTGLPFAFLNDSNNFQKFKMFGNDYAQMRDASAGGSANNTYMDCYKESSGTSTQAASWDNSSIHRSNAQKKLFLAFVYNTT